MTEKERLLQGHLYHSSDAELEQMHLTARRALDRINATSHEDFQGRYQILKEICHSIGKQVIINKPFYFDYGAHISIGDRFYANYDCLLLDANHIIIGNDVQFGPKVSLLTAGHPLDASIRHTGLEFAKRIVIEDGVWLGANVIVNPGITIGRNSVIGSGSVVTKDIPPNCLAYGNPCRVIRQITLADRQIYAIEASNHPINQTK
jgi:maltose O-acetyltransferase